MAITKEQRAILTSQSAILDHKLKIKFDITTLDLMISFIYKDSVLRTRKALSHIKRLFEIVDMRQYEDNPECTERIWIINTFLKGKLEENLTDDVLLQYCLDNPDCSNYAKDIIKEFKLKEKLISYENSKYLIRKVDDILQCGYVTTIRDTLLEIINSMDDEDEYKSFKAIQEDLYEIATAIINIKRNNSTLGSDNTFSLDPEVFDNVVEEALKRLRDRNRIFITGIRMLNILLSPGFMSKRLYVFLALPGKGKSTMLLKAALDIRKYNRISPKDPTKRPAVLLLVLENSVEETIERIYNMEVDSDDIRNYTVAQVKKKMREKGNLKLTKDSPVDIIIKEYKNRELDTDDLYTITNDLLDEGIEVCALVLDYIKRIRPAERAKDEKEELKNISNELKEYAKYWDVPVITAQQLNRAGASVIDAAIGSNKEDVTRLVGQENIGTAWEIQENADMTMIINPEIKYDTNELFMVFKMLKRRYRSIESDDKLRRKTYFAHPFEPGNEIRLIDDIHMPKSISLDTLASVAFEDIKKSEDTLATDQKKKKKKKASYGDYADDYDSFDFATAVNY